MSEDASQEQASPGYTGLKPHDDARAIVRLFQCAQCSYPIREPIILPCGNSICKPCLPSSHTRANITYPQNADRVQGFDCPFKDCAMEHPMADCSVDVNLQKMVELVKAQVLLDALKSTENTLRLDEKLHMRNLLETSIDVMPRSRVSNGGRIVAAFTMASAGELNYHSDVAFTPINSDVEESVKAADLAIVENFRDIIRAECECQVCYSLMVDPLTTACGHTFCRKCVARVLDHSNLCPACRRPLPMQPGVATEPSNKRMTHAVDGLLAEELAARIAALQEEDVLDEEGWMPMFPVTLAFPHMPTFLHVFEPRYRLMVRRVIENGSRKFGMMMYNGRRIPQGHLGRSIFMQYGTALHISRVEIFPDGRSLLETHGLYRFKVLEASMLDGYHIARVQRIEDMPLAEEEAAEALETASPDPPEEDAVARINHMSTQALLQYGLDFIAQARSRSERWLHERVLAAYGQPPTDPATFPYWFASILPIAEDEKYQLLPLTSVRERLKLTARWIQVIEESRCARFRVTRLARPLESEPEEANQAQRENSSSSSASAARSLEPEAPQSNQAESPVTTENTEPSPSSQAQQT